MYVTLMYVQLRSTVCLVLLHKFVAIDIYRQTAESGTRAVDNPYTSGYTPIAQLIHQSSTDDVY